MRNYQAPEPRNAARKGFTSLFLAVFLLAALYGTIAAYQTDVESAPPDLSNSSKSVDREEAELADVVGYTVLMRNDGGEAASEVVMTDTLPSELNYVAGSLEVIPDIGLYGESNDVITWTGALNVSQEIVLNFQAVVTGAVEAETTITNTAIISTTSQVIERSAATSIISDTTFVLHFPFIQVPAPPVTLALISGPSAKNQWTLGFEPESFAGVTGYEIQEAQNPSFDGAALLEVSDPNVTSIDRTKTASFSNAYYYRARTKAGEVLGPWSNTVLVAGNYVDNFNDPGSGWRTVREDTDDIDQSSYYSGGRYVHRQKGRWDYLISSPVKPAPQGPYRLEAKMKFVGVDNLHTYGLVFGGDWNGRDCPNGDYSSCFNQYYRLLAVWYSDDSGRLKIQLKRIERHEDGNQGRGSSLIKFRDVRVDKPPSGWQHWAIDVYPDGRIVIWVDNNVVAEASDPNYTNDRYFGAFSATDEYAGLQVELDWFKVTALD